VALNSGDPTDILDSLYRRRTEKKKLNNEKVFRNKMASKTFVINTVATWTLKAQDVFSVL